MKNLLFDCIHRCEGAVEIEACAAFTNRSLKSKQWPLVVMLIKLANQSVGSKAYCVTVPNDSLVVSVKVSISIKRRNS